MRFLKSQESVSPTRHHSLCTQGCTTENGFRQGLEKLHKSTMGTWANRSSTMDPAFTWASSSPVMEMPQ